MFLPRAPRFRPRWLRDREQQLPEWLTDPQWIPEGQQQVYTRTRYGLYTHLKQQWKDAQKSVLLPDYIPHSVVAAFRQNDFTIQFYPVGPDLRLNEQAVYDRIEECDPDIVLFVHYFGFADPSFPRLADLANENGATIIEDCAHALFSRGRDGSLLGSTGEISLFSLYKLLPVPNGGLLVTKGATPPTPSKTKSEARDIFPTLALSALRTIGVSPHLLRYLQQNQDKNSVKPQVLGRADVASPGRLSNIGLRQSKPANIVSFRREQYRNIRNRATELDGVDVLTPPLYDGACPFGVAIRTTNDQERCETAHEKLLARGLPIQRLQWPLPNTDDSLIASQGSTVLRNEMLIIPTHQQLHENVGDLIASAFAQTT